MKEITVAEIFVFVFLGIVSWALSFIWLGWLGNFAVTLWAKSRGLKMKNPSRDLLLHLCSPFFGIFPFIPSALAQFFILYAEQRIATPSVTQSPRVASNSV